MAAEITAHVSITRANPAPRSHAVEDDVARDFEEEVPDEEDAGAQAVHRLAEAQRAQHLQLGEADVHAIEVGGAVAAEQEGDEALSDAAVSP